MQIPIREIQIKGGRRSLDAGHVKELTDSIRELGLLNPLTIDRGNFLIAGLHRLEAVKALGWAEVECTVSSLEGLAAELAEIDENIVRSDISALEYGEVLLRRKEIYEALHPETKRGGDRKGEEIKTSKCRFDMGTSKSFAQDTAEKLGVGRRTVERQIQTAKNLAPGAKEIIKGAGMKITKKTAMELSRLEPGKQKEAAALLTAGEIKSVGEYTEKAAGPLEMINMPEEQETSKQEAKEDPGRGDGEAVKDKLKEAATEPEPVHMGQEKAGREEKPGASLKEVVADLKNADKDCSGTPESFLAEYTAFVRKFHKEISWYNDPYYEVVFPCMDGKQLAYLREQTNAICSTAEELFHKVERMMKNELPEKALSTKEK